MSLPDSDAVAGLRRLLGEDGPALLDRHWGSGPLVRTAGDRGGDTLADLLPPEAIDELVSRRGLRTPFLRVARDGTTLPDRAFTAGGGVGAGITDQVSDDRLLRLLDEGATLVLQGLHRTWEPIRALAAEVAGDLGHPVQANAYVTPATHQGFSAHYDVHDVLVVQLHGTKTWIIHQPVLAVPRRDQPSSARATEVAARAEETPTLEVTLAPGDVLYLPRGWIHAARSQGSTSTHLTLGIHPWTRTHLLEEMLERAGARLGDELEARQALPLGRELVLREHTDLADEVEEARRLLARVVAELPAAEVLDAVHQRARAAQRPEPVAPLAQLAAAADLRPEQVLRLRRHLLAELAEEPGGAVTLSSRAGVLTLTPAPGQLQAVRALLEVGRARVADLAGTGDEEDALDLGRRLLRHGLVLREDGPEGH